MHGACRSVLAGAGAVCFLAAAPSAALAAKGSGSPPVIIGEAVSKITQNDATLEAQIDTEGVEFGAWYQFQVDEFPSEIECPPLELISPLDGCGPGPQVASALPIRFVVGGSADQTVSLDLANGRKTLQPGTAYSYRVLVAPSEPPGDTIRWVPPPVSGPVQTFTTVNPLPTSKAQCKKGGWKKFGTKFKNQGQCVSFVGEQPAIAVPAPAPPPPAPGFTGT